MHNDRGVLRRERWSRRAVHGKAFVCDAAESPDTPRCPTTAACFAMGAPETDGSFAT